MIITGLSGHYVKELDLVTRTGMGKIILPIDLRQPLIDAGVSRLKVMRWLDYSLALLPYENWAQLAESVRSLSYRDDHRLIRLLVNSAVTVDMDAQGRVFLPEYFLKYAFLTNKKEVLLLGEDDKVEVWNVERFAEIERQLDGKSTDLIKNYFPAHIRATSKPETQTEQAASLPGEMNSGENK